MTEITDNHTIDSIMQGGVIGSLTLVEDEDHNVRAPKETNRRLFQLHQVVH